MSKPAHLRAQLTQWLAQPAAAITTGTGGATVGSDYSGNDKGAGEEDGGCDCEDDAFHGCFSL